MPAPVGRAGQARQSTQGTGGSPHQRELRLARAAGRCGQRARKGKGMARSARRPGRQAQIAGLLLALLLGFGEAWSAGGGASVGTPPGGPPDSVPPTILAVKPESGGVVPNLRGDAVIQFDEVIEEMAGTRAGLSPPPKQILLSPGAGEGEGNWHRSTATLKPKEGWKRRAD